MGWPARSTTTRRPPADAGGAPVVGTAPVSMGSRVVGGDCGQPGRRPSATTHNRLRSTTGSGRTSIVTSRRPCEAEQHLDLGLHGSGDEHLAEHGVVERGEVLGAAIARQVHRPAREVGQQRREGRPPGAAGQVRERAGQPQPAERRRSERQAVQRRLDERVAWEQQPRLPQCPEGQVDPDRVQPDVAQQAQVVRRPAPRVQDEVTATRERPEAPHVRHRPPQSQGFLVGAGVLVVGGDARQRALVEVHPRSSPGRPDARRAPSPRRRRPG
jgi:hypothetical protein